MNRRLGILLCATAALIACDDDPNRPEGGTGPIFQPLTSRGAVVSNLELAWNERRTDKLSELVDGQFAFYFSQHDVNAGRPVKWDRAHEISAANALFVSNTVPDPEGPLCRSIRVDFDNNELTWMEVPAPFSSSGEVWYRTTISYTFRFEMDPGMTYVAPSDAKAELTVRPWGEEWRLVEWRDLAYQDSRTGTTSTAEVPSWGAIKELYEPAFLLLVGREAVLENLETAWNERRADKLDELLDSHFQFYFSPGDVGGSVPESWNRTEEMATSSALFTSNEQPDPPSFPVCNAVNVDLVFNTETITWIQIIPEDFPQETWFVVTVFYSFVFDLEPDVTYIAAGGSKAQLAVRQVDDEWRLVEWRDLGGTAAETSLADVSEATWGGIKALYLSPAASRSAASP